MNSSYEPTGDDDSHKALFDAVQSAFDGVGGELLGMEESYQEARAEALASERTVFRSFDASDDPQLQFVARWVIEHNSQTDQPETAGELLERIISSEVPDDMGAVARYIALREGLDSAARIALGITYDMGDLKQEAQLKIIENEYLAGPTKTALLRIAEELMEGEGIDMADPDSALQALTTYRETKAVQERRDNLIRSLGQFLRGQVEFMEAHSIHPGDPAWSELRSGLTYEYFAKHDVALGDAGSLGQELVQSAAATLRLSEEAVAQLRAAIADHFGSDEA